MILTDRRFTPEEAAAIRADYAAGVWSIAGLCKKWDCSDKTIGRVIHRQGCYSEEGERDLRETEAG